MINEFRPMNHLTSLQNFICTIGNLPTSYALSLSYEEQIWWLCDFLEKKVFPAIEENTNITEETQQAFVELQQYVTDYFNNLDVQEEINNKLDEMAESGILEEIIISYLEISGVICFDNVEDLKASTNLKDGSFAKTLGYYSINDGGGSLYKIVESENEANDCDIIQLNNGLRALLILQNRTINSRQFGCVGDGVTDETEKITNLLKYKRNNYIKIIFEPGIYLAQGRIELFSNTEIDLGGATIKCNKETIGTGSNGLVFINNANSIIEHGYGAIKDFKLYNGILDGHISGIMFPLFHAENFTFKDLIFKDCFVATHIFDLAGCKNIKFLNCDFDGNLITVESSNYREMIQLDYARQTSWPYMGDDESIAFDNLPTTDVLIDGCSFKKGNGQYFPNAIGNHATGIYPISNIIIRNSKFYDCTYASIRIPFCENVLIENNIFYNVDNSTRSNISFIRFEYTNDFNLTDNVSKNIKILNNTFKPIENGNGNILGVRIRGNRTNEYYIKDILIKNNNFISTYENETGGADAIDTSMTDNIIISDNICEKVKNFIFKPDLGIIKNGIVSNNIISYSRDFLRSGGNLSTDNETKFNQSNNIWIDERGSININNFIAKFTLNDNFDITTDGVINVPFITSDNPFFTIDENNRIHIPKFIPRFSSEIEITLVTANDNDLRQLYSYILIGSESFNQSITSFLNNGSTRKTLQTIKDYFEINKIVANEKILVPRFICKNGDSIRKDELSHEYYGSMLILKGF